MGLFTKLRLVVLSYRTKFDLKGISLRGGLVNLEREEPHRRQSTQQKHRHKETRTL